MNLEDIFGKELSDSAPILCTKKELKGDDLALLHFDYAMFIHNAIKRDETIDLVSDGYSRNMRNKYGLSNEENNENIYRTKDWIGEYTIDLLNRFKK